MDISEKENIIAHPKSLEKVAIYHLGEDTAIVLLGMEFQNLVFQY